MKAIFEGLCPNCGKSISDVRISIGAPCSRCIDIPTSKLIELYNSLSFEDYQIKIGELLKERGKLWRFKYYVELARSLKEFEDLFNKFTGKRLWSAQREWAKRVFKGLSFSINAPTGVGKTVFGITISLYLASKGKKCYFILPTQALVLQVYEKALNFASRVGLDLKILHFKSRMKKSEREEFFNSLENGDFDILITTSRFLSIHFDKMKNLRFDLIFVDDVDAVLKSSKNIDKILFLIGVSFRDISIALELIRLKKRLINLKSEKAKQKIFERIAKLERILERSRRFMRGVLIVSTATGRARGERVKLFREILNFTVGSSTISYRNIVDFYVKRVNVKDQVLRLVRRLGAGGLIFVGIDDGSYFAEELAEYLKSNGVNVEAYISGKSKPEVLQRFADGDIDILVGMASYYGILVRGLDLPQRIRYAIFTSIPKFRFSLKFEETSPFRLYVLLQDLSDYMEADDRKIASELLTKFKMYILSLERSKLEKLTRYLKEGKEVKEFTLQISLCKQAIAFLKNVFNKKEFLENLERSPYFSIKEVNGTRYILLPDVRTYIQASGRTSRLFAGGITRGVSIVLVDDEKLFRGLKRQLSWYYEEAEFIEFNDMLLNSVLREVDRDRELVKMILEGKLTAEFKDPVKSALLIVESPHKAETIANFFGRPSRREIGEITVYEVTTGNLTLNIVASKGHILDLVEDKGFYGVLIQGSRFIPIYGSIKKCRQCGHQFISGDSCPKCNSKEISDAMERIKGIRELASEVDIVFLGSDPDEEGEKIAWDLNHIVKTSSKEVRRLEFHEVTRRAIKKALENLRDIDENLVNAQIVRRIEDRWLGFQLSKTLWKAFKNRALSAGRVQTPVLGWIIKRYDEYRKSWTVIVKLTMENGQVIDLEDIDNPNDFVKNLKNRGYVDVIESSIKEKEINPPPPFTTDSMLLEASRILKFSATKTMNLAQTLFESGLITYHRTDSIRVSNEGIRVASEYIHDRFHEDVFKPRRWAPEEIGAHECIRPVRPIDSFELSRLIREGIITRGGTLTNDHIKLYDLIFKRFIASQMKAVRVKVQKLKLRIIDMEREFEQIVDVIEDGFNLIYPIKTWPILLGKVMLKEINQIKAPKVYPYTQGEIIKEMRERGIGRPSTYAIIIQKLLNRKYIIERKGRLIPTKLGRQVYRFLTKRYGNLVSERVTRELEHKMDMVKRGLDYQKVLFDEYRIIKKIII